MTTKTKEQLYKTARALISCAEFKAGDIVSVEYMPNTRWGGETWYLINGDKIAYPEHHLTDFVL